MGPVEAIWGGSEVTVPASVGDVRPGDVVVRRPPGRSSETYSITNAKFRSGLLDIPDTWVLTVRRERRLDLRAGVSSTMLMDNAHRVPVGNLTLADVQVAFQALLDEINAADATPFLKQEARARVFRLLNSRTIEATLGKKAKAIRRLLAANFQTEAERSRPDGDTNVFDLQQAKQ